MIEAVSSGDRDFGGSLQGTITASYARLVELFGPPNSEGDGYKVSTEWCLKHNGRRFRLYDYKDTNLYDSDNPSVEEFRNLKSFEWHVGASDASVTGLIAELREML